MMEEYTKDNMSIGNVLSPILAPGITRKVVRSGSQSTDESSALGFCLSF
jgi:hypothetical protein